MNEKISEKSPKFICQSCDYKCSKQSEYSKHLITRKHVKNSNLNEYEQKNIQIYSCKVCNKTYKGRNGLWYHEQKCVSNTGMCNMTKTNENNTIALNPQTVQEVTSYDPKRTIEDIMNNEIVKCLIRENTEFKQIMIEQNKQICQLIQEQTIAISNSTNVINTNTHNSHNKTFNLNFFLNEQCKDAMNINDFVMSLDLQMEDLESLGEKGYVEGMTNIIAKRLRDMDVYKRPIHCSDAKREILHIKHDNQWHKEEPGNPIFRNAVRMVVGGNFRLLSQWTVLHPEFNQYHSRWNDVYLKLVKETSGGRGDYESNNDAIMRRLTKLVVIEK